MRASRNPLADIGENGPLGSNLLQINTMLNVYKMMLRSQQMLHFSCANFLQSETHNHCIIIDLQLIRIYHFNFFQIADLYGHNKFIIYLCTITIHTIYYHLSSRVINLYHLYMMLKPFPFLAEGGIRPPTSILWQFWTHSSSCSARCIPWYVLNCYIEQSFDHKSCVEVHPSPRPSKVSASPCATVSLWKNPLVAVEVLFHWLKPPMEVRHDHEVKPFGPGSFVHAVYPETCAPCVRFVMGHCDSQVYWTELDWRRLEDGLWFFAENDHSKTWSLSQVEELTRVARMYQHDIRM